ncbi:recombinase family protein [Sulfurirhabdus autotrophica]|uniref:DNA invertase Pin-like site-specific DNA recombinase n=1 Tax=Sulfurirhabdus autotrophica TaxID=1706046 RepID=A0A4R3Y3U4_9PROT|nr:recombinase family protein [Sulfurirhabdus autotrophica]TCV86327.1 DNA invertase Pin-like site-specific DNA recombinase [Sulfurirhabdus autotrophica]
MAKAYSYLRFSTPEQLKGDSLRRQTQLAKDYTLRHNLELDESLTFDDLGISAYRGKNKDTGGLALFLEAIEAGIVKSGDYLLVESLDRLSREKPRKALRVLEEIIEAGVAVVTLIDGKQYTEEVMDDDAFGLLGSLLIMSRAHEESKTKARRLSEAWKGKRITALEKPLTAMIPQWMVLNKKTSTIELIPERAEVVKRIFSEYGKGKGKHIIARDLNTDNIPVFGRGKQWHSSYVFKILTNRACIGEFTPHHNQYIEGKIVRVPLDSIDNYYPAVVDEDTFQVAQGIKQSRTRENKPVGGKPSIHNLLSHLAKCPLCGSTMTRVNKGNKWQYYLCTKAKTGNGCTYKTVNFEKVNDSVINSVADLAENKPSFNTNETEIREKINQCEIEIGVGQESIENLLDIAQKGGSPSVLTRINEVESSIEDAKKELDRLISTLQSMDNTLLDKRLGDLIEASNEDPIDTQRFNAVLLSLFSKVVINYDNLELDYYWKDTDHVISVPYDYLWPEAE